MIVGVVWGRLFHSFITIILIIVWCYRRPSYLRFYISSLEDGSIGMKYGLSEFSNLKQDNILTTIPDTARLHVLFARKSTSFMIVIFYEIASTDQTAAKV